MTLHCRDCRREWTIHPMVHPVSPTRLVTALKGYVAAGCPHCGAYGEAVLLGPTPPEGYVGTALMPISTTIQ